MSGQYSMNTDPQTWPRPDDVDVIVAQEAWEQTEDYENEVVDWLTTSDHAIEWAFAEFPSTSRYEAEFARWLDGRAAA